MHRAVAEGHVETARMGAAEGVGIGDSRSVLGRRPTVARAVGIVVEAGIQAFVVGRIGAVEIAVLKIGTGVAIRVALTTIFWASVMPAPIW